MRLVLLLASLFPLAALAGKDMGRQGPVWPITELDARAVLQAQAEKLIEQGNLGFPSDKMVEKVEAKFPKFSLGRVEQTSLRKVDPSQVLARDIWAPMPQQDGSVKETLVARKGTRLNPLEKIRPTGGFLVVDGNDQAQVKLLREVLVWTGDFMPVLSKGRPVELSKDVQQPIYFLRPEMEQTFKLRHTPALVWAGEKENRGYLMVLELGVADYSTQAIARHYTPIITKSKVLIEAIKEVPTHEKVPVSP